MGLLRLRNGRRKWCATQKSLLGHTCSLPKLNCVSQTLCTPVCCNTQPGKCNMTQQMMWGAHIPHAHPPRSPFISAASWPKQALEPLWTKQWVAKTRGLEAHAEGCSCNRAQHQGRSLDCTQSRGYNCDSVALKRIVWRAPDKQTWEYIWNRRWRQTFILLAYEEIYDIQSKEAAV